MTDEFEPNQRTVTPIGGSTPTEPEIFDRLSQAEIDKLVKDRLDQIAKLEEGKKEVAQQTSNAINSVADVLCAKALQRRITVMGIKTALKLVGENAEDINQFQHTIRAVFRVYGVEQQLDLFEGNDDQAAVNG